MNYKSRARGPAGTKAGIILSCAIALTLTGCGGMTLASSQAAKGANGRDSSAPGAEPLAGYMAEELDRIQLAQDTLRITCIADNGFPELRRFIPEDRITSRTREQITYNPDDIFFESESDARKRGFGRSIPARPDKVIPHEVTYEGVSETCAKVAWEQLDKDALQTFLEYQQIGYRMHSSSADVAVPAAEKVAPALLKCLQDEGAPVTAGSEFFGMTLNVKRGSLERPEEEGPSPKKTSGIEIIPGIPENRYIPTPEESDLAASVYRCSLSAGVRDEHKRIMTAPERDAYAANMDKLNELEPGVRRLSDTATALLKQ